MNELNRILDWIASHGHKVLIWSAFLIQVILWIQGDPNPEHLMDSLSNCISITPTPVTYG